MIWYKYTIETVDEATDIVASVLYDNGVVGAEIEDSKDIDSEDLKMMYVDIPEKRKNDGKAKVSFYLEKDNIDIDKIKIELEDYRNYINMGSLNITKNIVDDKDIFTKWRENFKRIDVGDVHIIPAWEKENNHDKNSLNIYIDPGSAFGTGQHYTTRLCIKSINDIIRFQKYKRSDSSFLDIGCGSGILAIFAYICGIKNVSAIDIDEKVKDNLINNVKLNDIDIEKSGFKYSFGNIIDDLSYRDEISQNKYDIVVANILAPVIIDLLDKAKIHDIINDNGYFICSGILVEYKDKVIASIEKTNVFDIVNIDIDSDWVCISAKKRISCSK